MTQKKPKNIFRRLRKPERNYIVVDFEWNQAMRRNAEVFNHLPIHLRGEIIEIGAVKLRGDYGPGEEFTIDVKPQYFRQMHYKVKKITGIDSARLANACTFPEAMKRFAKWAGENPVFVTWGSDDRGIFEQNVIIHDLDYDWIEDWINLQPIYSVQTEGDKNQVALEKAMEHFGIEQARVAHDALGDAYNTALVCSHLNMPEGFRKYGEAEKILATRMPAPEPKSSDGTETLLHDAYEGFESKAAAFADSRISVLTCPECGGQTEKSRWINQGDGRYMNIFECPNCGKYLMRVRFRKCEDNTMTANRLVYKADDDMLAFYKEKSSQARRRGRSSRSGRRKK